MFKTKVILSLVFISIFTSCSVKETGIVTDEKIQNPYLADKVLIKEIKQEEILEVEPIVITPVVVEVYSNEKDFLDILKNDRYASLCGDKTLYNKILTIQSPESKSKFLEELLIKYTNNLANGCIDIKDMNKKMARNRAKKIKNSFKVYTQKVDSAKVLEQYRSKEMKISEILKPYIPKHPDYLTLIKHLENEKLSKEEKYKLRLNIERLKLVKSCKSDNFIQLNIPAYSFDFYEDSQKSMSFGTVVGDLEDQTPVMSAKLSYFIMNPTWNIPDSIAKKTIIPRMLKDKRYLSKKGIVIRKNYNLSSKKYKQSDISWNKYLKESVRYIPYKFIQLPSSTNGMGRVKFIFPNEYAVYMHDTIGTWRFKSPKQSIRAVSHGCVRLENPLGLIKYLSANYTARSYESVKADYDARKVKTVSLSEKLPVHITYMTAYIDGKNGISFYKDLYGYDSLQKLNFKL